MDIEKAVAIIDEIAEGDQEKEAVKVIKDGIAELIENANRYRALYEGAVKKIERYRDVASKVI